MVSESEKTLEGQIKHLLAHLPVSEETLEEIRTKTLEQQRNILALMYSEECRRARTRSLN